MHVRFSTAEGMPVTAAGGDVVGTLSSPFIHPDTGCIEGFFVRLPGVFPGEQPFLASQDILHWGTAVHIDDADVLAPLSERIRLSALAAEGRPMLGQPMQTESGARLGTCRDVQFETKTFRVEWLFPRKWWRWRTPVSVTAVLEVKPEAIIVRDGLVPVKPTIMETIVESQIAPVPEVT